MYCVREKDLKKGGLVWSKDVLYPWFSRKEFFCSSWFPRPRHHLRKEQWGYSFFEVNFPHYLAKFWWWIQLVVRKSQPTPATQRTQLQGSLLIKFSFFKSYIFVLRSLYVSGSKTCCGNWKVPVLMKNPFSLFFFLSLWLDFKALCHQILLKIRIISCSELLAQQIKDNLQNI